MAEKIEPEETAKDDPPKKTDWAPYPQSDEPWKQNAQNTTDSSLQDTPKPDLEKWERTKTH